MQSLLKITWIKTWKSDTRVIALDNVSIYFNFYLFWLLKADEKFPVLLVGPLLHYEVPSHQLSHSLSQTLQKDGALHLPVLKQVRNIDGNCYCGMVTLFLLKYAVTQNEIPVGDTARECCLHSAPLEALGAGNA